jgi:hypothetical protein
VGEIVQLAQPACRCGWRYPARIEIATDEPINGTYFAILTCPSCGRESETRRADDGPKAQC